MTLTETKPSAVRYAVVRLADVVEMRGPDSKAPEAPEAVVARHPGLFRIQGEFLHIAREGKFPIASP
jgi:hypothetical protein